MLVDNEGSFPGLERELGFTLPECVPRTTVMTVVGVCLCVCVSVWKGIPLTYTSPCYQSIRRVIWEPMVNLLSSTMYQWKQTGLSSRGGGASAGLG